MAIVTFCFATSSATAVCARLDYLAAAEDRLKRGRRRRGAVAGGLTPARRGWPERSPRQAPTFQRRAVV